MAMLWLPRLPRRVLALKLQAGALDDGRRDAHCLPGLDGDSPSCTVGGCHLDEGDFQGLVVLLRCANARQFGSEVQLALDQNQFGGGVGNPVSELLHHSGELALDAVARPLATALGLARSERLEVGTDDAGLLAPLLECLLVRC